MALSRRKKKKNSEPKPAPDPLGEAGESAVVETPDQEDPQARGASVPGDAPVAEEPASGKEKAGLLGRLFIRLSRTREKLSGSIDRITLARKIDNELLDELEEVLVTADLGVITSLELIEGLRGRIKRKELGDAQALKTALQNDIVRVLQEAQTQPEREGKPHVIMVVGVNGVGKTTTIAKLAHRFQCQGRSVLLAAADTFRAAAGDQLQVWAERVGCDLVRQKHGADPSAVAFDAMEAALSRRSDLVIVDTAGRLPTNTNLMEELRKVHRVVGKKLPGAPHEVLLVVDATTGQNAISQARLFNEAVGLSGVALTKLDGTAKGGVVAAIAREMGLPVLFIGIGEKMDDLRPFDPQEFVAAIF